MRYCLPLVLLLQSVAFAEPIRITDSRGRITFAESPQRVVVLNWALTEQLLELGLKPLGVADIEGYRQQGGKPAVDGATIDVGKRTSPDFKKIAALKPDVILVGHSQRPFLRTLGQIATVVYFKNFSRRYNNEEKSRQRLMELAKLFGKQDRAKARVQERDENIRLLKQQLQTHFDGGLPVVTMLVPDRKHLWIFAENSMPYYAAKQLGLSLSRSFPPSQYGVHKLALDELPMDPGCILILSTGGPADTSLVSSLNKLSPCVQEVEPSSIYGGSMSIQYLAEAITAALLAKLE